MGLVRSKTPQGERDRWRTPDVVYRMLDRRYGPFTLDAAADAENHKCDLWLGPGGLAEDALGCEWGCTGLHRVFCNPPYTLTAGFIRKAKAEAGAGNVLAATLIVPATTDVRWFHDHVWESALDRPQAGVFLAFSQGRIRFLRPDGSLAGTPTHGSLFVTFAQPGQGRLL